jgi:hypothetical protein
VKPYFADPARGMVGIVIGSPVELFQHPVDVHGDPVLTPAMRNLPPAACVVAAFNRPVAGGGIFTLDMPNYPAGGRSILRLAALFVIGLVLGIKRAAANISLPNPLKSPRLYCLGAALGRSIQAWQ